MAAAFQSCWELCGGGPSPSLHPREQGMAAKGFTGAPFGTQTVRFDVSAVYPNCKKPGTYTQAPYCKKVSSELGRKLGPGTYNIDYGSVSSSMLQEKASNSGWARAQEVARLTQMPHFNFKETLKKTKYLKEKLGPGTYNIKDFLQETRPSSIRGACDTGEERFRDLIRDCYPGPGSYGKNGNPYALIEEKERRLTNAQGIMDSKTEKSDFPSAAGSGLGPATYNLKNGTDEMLKQVISNRGPYDTFTGDRSKPIICGHYAVEKKCLELGTSNVKSFVEELNTKDRKKKGIFSTLPRNPGCPSERIFWATLSQCPRATYAVGPGSHDPKHVERSEYFNQPPFWSSAERVDRKAYRLFIGNTNPVGVGRYDIRKQDKCKWNPRYRSLYQCETHRYLSNLEQDAILQKRINPVNRRPWNNLVSATSDPDTSEQVNAAT
nr:lymphocyte expansion molecule isoform X2 [Pelodiscus sinensis]XP_025045639.1 lymphocyte expansion molecule isoform X2 [Pelodiscus sinensis]|eukprot:XP_025045638.1 lymphocyte expansion molecule isoform X2 [Pelodiscus sinensis]